MKICFKGGDRSYRKIILYFAVSYLRLAALRRNRYATRVPAIRNQSQKIQDPAIWVNPSGVGPSPLGDVLTRVAGFLVDNILTEVK